MQATRLETDLPGPAYHAEPGWSSSQIKAMGISPAHFYGMYVDPFRPEQKDKPQFRFGRMVHTMVLEPDKFDDEYIVPPQDVNLRTKIGKQMMVDFKDDNPGKEFITPDEYAQAEALRDAVLNNHAACALLESDDIEFEQSGWWKDERTDLLLKYRPDARTDRCIIDLKTTAGPVDYESIQKAIWNFNYHTSAAHYLDGDRACRGTDHDTFVLIFVGKTWPHDVGVYYLDADAIELGRRQNRTWLHRIADCLETKRWPPVNDGEITEIALPHWGLKKLGV